MGIYPGLTSKSRALTILAQTSYELNEFLKTEDALGFLKEERPVTGLNHLAQVLFRSCVTQMWEAQ